MAYGAAAARQKQRSAANYSRDCSSNSHNSELYDRKRTASNPNWTYKHDYGTSVLGTQYPVLRDEEGPVPQACDSAAAFNET